MLPWSSSAVTSTGGWIVTGQGNEVLGWTVKASFVTASLSVSTEPSHVLGELKYQFHVGWTGPVVAGTSSSPSTTIHESDMVLTFVQPTGLSAPTNALDIDTPYASEPAPTVTAPGSATVGYVEPEPEA